MTPDPDAFEKYRDTPPISIAMLLQKYALLLAQKVVYTPPFCITIRLPFVSRYLIAEVLGSGVVGTLPVFWGGNRRCFLFSRIFLWVFLSFPRFSRSQHREIDREREGGGWKQILGSKMVRKGRSWSCLNHSSMSLVTKLREFWSQLVTYGHRASSAGRVSLYCTTV